MSAAKKTSKYKENPYYGVGYTESTKSDSKQHDSRSLDDNKLPRLGTHFSVMKFSRNPFKYDASSGEGSTVQNIVSSFEKPLWRSKDTRKSSLTNSVILEEDPPNEEYEHDRFAAFNTGLQSDKRANIDGHNSSKGGSDMWSVPNKPSYNNSEAKHQSYDLLDDVVAGAQTVLGSYNLSFKSLVTNVDMKDSLDHETTSHMQGNLPLQDHLLGYSFQNRHTSSFENQGFRGPSMQVSFFEEAPPSCEKNLVLEDGKPYEADLHKEDLVEASDRTEDDPMTNLENKDHHTAVKFTGSHKDERIYLSGVASAFYNGGSLGLHGVLSCSSITKINDFLDERCDELHAGVPGKWLTIVLGKKSSELSTIAATITYSYFLALTTKQDQLCVVPLLNMARADLALNPDITWLLRSIGLHTSSLLFLDEINLSYFHRFGSLRLVLVNHTKLCPSQESFKDDVEEILAIHDEVENAYPHLKTVISDEDVGSSCTIIAESYAKHQPELLAGKALCRLLLAGILLDTKNLTTETTTRRDVSMATLLLNGAGKFGRNGLFKILKQKSHDLSDMNTNEILRKELKKLTFGSSGNEATRGILQQYEKNLGMSSLPIPLSEVLAWEEDSSNIIAKFPSHMGLSFFVLVTGYYETMEIFKREVLLVAEDNELMESISSFLLSSKIPVKFVPMLMPGLPSCIKGFSLEGKRISRTLIQSIIEDYFSG